MAVDMSWIMHWVALNISNMHELHETNTCRRKLFNIDKLNGTACGISYTFANENWITFWASCTLQVPFTIMNCIFELNYKFCCIIMVHKSFASSSYEVSILLDEADQNNHANFEQEYHKNETTCNKIRLWKDVKNGKSLFRIRIEFPM